MSNSGYCFRDGECRWLVFRAVALLLAWTLWSRWAWAISIQVLSGAGPAGFPAFDPGGELLSEYADYAAAVWEDIIEDPWTVSISVQYDNVGGLASGTATSVLAGKPTLGEVKIDTLDDTGTEQPWWFDPTPLDDSEFLLAQRLYRDLTAVQKSQWYGGDPPAVLEVSYRGMVNAAAPPEAAAGFDLFTSLVHEMGHVLGLSSSMAQSETVTEGDFAFDVVPDFVAGREMSVLAAGTDPGNVNHWSHIAAQSLMCSACAAAGLRRQLSATDVLAVASAADWLELDLPRKDVSGIGLVDWNLGSSWIGGAIPDTDDDVFLRDPSVTSVEIAGSGEARNISVESPVALTVASGSQLAVTGRLTMEEGGVVALNKASAVLVDEFELGGGRLALEIGGLLRGTHFVALNVAERANFSGTLDLKLVDSFQPALGDTMSILVSSGIIDGTFASIDAADAPLGVSGAGEPLHWLIDGGHTDRIDLLVAVPGDMDLDGDIDFDDIDDFVMGLSDPDQYRAIRGHGAAALGDLDGDRDLDFDDISPFSAALTAASASAAAQPIFPSRLRILPSHSVPEPGTHGLALAAGTCIWLARGLLRRAHATLPKTASTPASFPCR